MRPKWYVGIKDNSEKRTIVRSMRVIPDKKKAATDLGFINLYGPFKLHKDALMVAIGLLDVGGDIAC